MLDFAEMLPSTGHVVCHGLVRMQALCRQCSFEAACPGWDPIQVCRIHCIRCCRTLLVVLGSFAICNGHWDCWAAGRSTAAE